MKALRERLLSPAVYAYMVHGDNVIGNLSVTLAEAICRSWSVDLETLDELGLKRWPTSIENFMAAEACAKQFGDLSTVEGFYRHNDLWRLDLDDRFYQTGFLMPVSHPKHGYIDRIVAFKNPRDSHPFPLKTRRELRQAA